MRRNLVTGGGARRRPQAMLEALGGGSVGSQPQGAAAAAAAAKGGLRDQCWDGETKMQVLAEMVTVGLRRPLLDGDGSS
jgi:hypothetical protein